MIDRIQRVLATVQHNTDTCANPTPPAQAMAVIDRIQRALATVSEHIFCTIDPIARAFGEAFGCESWAVNLFAEEVIRGGPAFAVALVLRRWAFQGAWVRGGVFMAVLCFGHVSQGLPRCMLGWPELQGHLLFPSQGLGQLFL